MENHNTTCERALARLDELREDLRRAYGTIGEHEYEARAAQLGRLGYRLHKAVADIYRAGRFPVYRAPNAWIAQKSGKGGSRGDEI